MASFSKKHYQAVADVLDHLPEQPSKDTVIAAFAHLFANDNQRFDKSRFAAACKPERGAL